MIEESLHTIASIGAKSLEIFWFPAVIWIILSAVILGLLHLARNQIDLLYHYHLPCSLLLSLPMGIVIMQLFETINTWNSEAAEVFVPVFVMQSPLTVAAPAEGTTASSPDLFPLLLGAVLLILGAVSIVKIAVMLFHIGKLALWEKAQTPSSIFSLDSLSVSNRTLAGRLFFKPAIYFDKKTNTPFTFGFLKPAIVLPGRLRNSSEKMNMALRHELLHIYRGDYILNLLLTSIYKLFWFIPLVKYAYRQSKTYRELSCDNAVLTDPEISERKYAELLFELAPQNNGIGQAVLSMSVKPSMLKNRIKIMKNHKPKFPSPVKSLSFLTVTFLALSMLMACSDMQSNTSADEKELSEITAEMESKISDLKGAAANSIIEQQPLWIVNGKEIDNSKGDKPVLNNMAPENIASIEVLKGETAVDIYGKEAQNGVVIITTKEPVDAKGVEPSSTSMEIDGDFFRVVEEMPKLKGDMAEIQYPERARKAGIEGTVTVRFIVNKQGQVENPEIDQGIIPELDQEALRFIKNAEFEPGKQRGQAVRVQMIQPVVFQLPTSDSGDDSQENGQSRIEIRNLQTSGTQVTGYVYDASQNKPMAGAHITLTGEDKGAVTDKEGKFKVTNLDKGPYSIEISFIGYPTAQTNFTID